MADETKNYIPDPRESLLIHRESLYCSICFGRLELVGPTLRFSNPDFELPALLPCGHVIGAKCLEEWMKMNTICPCCLYKLVHKTCHHTVKPWVLTEASILYTPRTIPRGGKVKEECKRCRKDTNGRVTFKIYEQALASCSSAPSLIKQLALMEDAARICKLNDIEYW
jgi:hypothetical protein